MIVGIEGCNKVVEEVVKRLAENNWYVKLEKCKWKIRKVGFLGVVIGPNEIKIEEKKVKEENKIKSTINDLDTYGSLG